MFVEGPSVATDASAWDSEGSGWKKNSASGLKRFVTHSCSSLRDDPLSLTCRLLLASESFLQSSLSVQLHAPALLLGQGGGGWSRGGVERPLKVIGWVSSTPKDV